MKRNRVVLILAILLLLGGVWWWTGPRYALDGPPKLTVSAGEEQTQVGFWSADWASPAATFNACGAAPTDPATRSDLTVIYVAEGTENLTLSYPVAPSHVAVSFTPDRGGERVSLYDGGGKRKLSIPLPEDFRGIYEVIEGWKSVPPATGNAQRGFLVVREGESIGDPKLAEPPVLTVVKADGTAVTAQLGSYSWCVWLGGDEMEGTIADAAHPLDMSDLPALSAGPGDRLELQFSFPPGQMSVWAWPVGAGLEQEPMEVDTQSGDGVLVPELEGATVLEVRGSWSLAGDAGGEASYLFELS